MPKQGKKSRANKAAAALKSTIKKKRRLRRTVHFYKPKCQKQAREPKYQRKAVRQASTNDALSLIREPLTTEHAMKKIEDENTLVFIVSPMATKNKIKRAIKEQYQVEIAKVNSLIRPDGQKKAYVKLSSDFDALDVANKIGII